MTTPSFSCKTDTAIPCSFLGDILCHPETNIVSPCDEKRKHEYRKGCNNDEGVREETSRKVHTEVDGQSADRFETTPA